jgi:hypothetical protein
MLLLNATSLQLCDFQSDALPPYATFSSKWVDGDVMHEDLCCPQTARKKPGFGALEGACSECRGHGLQWLWNDAVCVDRKSDIALSQALNSLHDIYRAARLCIVYLHDLLDSQGPNFDPQRELSRCSWFLHVWMIPHLIFSKALYFYDTQWNLVGRKSELVPQLSQLTSIDEAVLNDSEDMKRVSSCTKMAWAAGLVADRVEDAAYSLLGIFGVNIPIKYGDGVRSFLRLQQEILKNTRSHSSLLAWQPRTSQPFRGLLAHSPLEFSHFRNRAADGPHLKGVLELQSDGFHVQAGLGGKGNDLLLPLYLSGRPAMWIVLTLWDGIFVRNCTETALNGAEISNVYQRHIRIRQDLSSDISDKIWLHRSAPLLEKRYDPPLSPRVCDCLLTEPSGFQPIATPTTVLYPI